MRERAYIEMRYDSDASVPDQKATVMAESALIEHALTTPAGEAFIKSAMRGRGNWYSRFLEHPHGWEKQSVKSGGELADPFWTFVGVCGSAVLLDAAHMQLFGKPNDQDAFDTVKGVVGLADGLVKDAPKEGVTALEKRVKNTGKEHQLTRKQLTTALEETEAAAANLAHAEAVIAPKEAAAAARLAMARTMEQRVLPWVSRFIGLKPGVAAYDWVAGKYVVLRNSVVAAAGPTAVDLHAWTEARIGVTQATQHLTDAEAAERFASQRFVAAEEFLARARRVATVTTSAVVALAAINAVTACVSLAKDQSAENWAKAGGALSEAIYSVEYFVQGAAGAGAIGAMRTLATVRVFGMVGSVVGLVLSLRAASRAFEDGNSGVGYAQMLAAAGSGVSLVGIAGVLEGATFGGPWVLAGAIIVLGALLIAAALTDAPLIRWLKTSQWGIKSHGALPATELQELFSLVLAPRVTATEVSRLATPAGCAAGGRYGLQITTQLSMLVPHETRIELDISVSQTTYGYQSGASFEMPVASLASVTLRVGPVTEEQLARSRQQPVLLTAQLSTPRNALSAQAAVTLASNRGSPEITVFLPLRSRVGEKSLPPYVVYGDVHVGGEAQLVLWTGQRGPAFPALHLKPYEIPRTDVTLTSRR